MTDHNKKEHNHGHEDHDKKHHEKKHEDSITISKKEHEELLRAKEAQQKLLYVIADFENFKKRNARDTEQQLTYANEKIIKEMLPIVDNLCRAKDHACGSNDKETSKEHFDKFLNGIELILKQLNDVLTKFGVKELSSVGEKFNPEFHEAMDQVETEEHDNGTIVNEYQKGYLLNNRVIRPSKVSVAKKKKED